MIRKFILLAIIFFVSLIIYEKLLKDNSIIDTFIEYIIFNKDNYILILLLNVLYFLTPLPVTPIILLNGFFYGYIGFLIIYPIIIIDSLIIFILSKRLIEKKFFKLFFKENIYKDPKFLKIQSASLNNYLVISTRYILPYFIHNLIYGVLNISWKKFLYLIALSEIPLTYAFIMLGNSLKDFVYKEINLVEIFYSTNFLIPLMIVLLFMILVKLINKKF